MRNPMTVAILSVVLASCATVSPGRGFHANIFNLSTGEVSACGFKPARMGLSAITVGPTKSGEVFMGEASEVDNQVDPSPYGSTSAFTSNSYTETYLSASRDRNARPGYKNERAILVGTRGTVISIDYRVDPSGNGEGEGSDSNGVRYRLQLSQQ